MAEEIHDKNVLDETEQAADAASEAPKQEAAQSALAQEELEKDLAQKEELVQEAEKVAAEKDWRQGSGDLRRLQERWNDLRRWHDPREDALWKRFQAAKDTYYAARDAAHESARKAKEGLIAQAERVAQSSQWNAGAEKLRSLMDEWKKAGRTGKPEEDDELWKRFNAARQDFYKKRSDYFSQLDEQRKQAKETKEKLIAEAREAAVTASDWTGEQWRQGSARMKELMDEWKKAGVAARADNDRLWEEFRAARQPFFDAQHAHYDALDAAHKEAAQAKQALIDEAKKLADGTDFGREAAERAKDLDRQWKQLGYAGREANDKLWDAFKDAKERFWDERRAYNEQRHEQWEERLSGAIERRKSRLARLQQQADRLQERLNNAYATDHVEEMQEDLDDRKEEIEDLKREIADMQGRLDGQDRGGRGNAQDGARG